MAMVGCSSGRLILAPFAQASFCNCCRRRADDVVAKGEEKLTHTMYANGIPCSNVSLTSTSLFHYTQASELAVLVRNGTAGKRTRRAPSNVACDAAKTSGNGGVSSDDYHATLRALNSKGRTPRKSLGQHYMLNSSINELLAGAADVSEGDVVLEIGPGTGSLTNVLISSGAVVLAVEKDPHMAALVTERFADTDRLKVLKEDFVKCHIRSHMTTFLESEKTVNAKSRHAKVVANIPFNISSDVIKLLLPMGDIFSEVVLLLQEETALRLVESSLRTSEYRPINIFVNFYSEPEFKFKVPRTNFFPQPNVDAAVVSFKLKQPVDYPLVSTIKSFFSMVNSAFNGKRKMLRKSLQHLCTSIEIERALEDFGLPATSRPEELSLSDFVRLHNFIENFRTLP